MPGVVCMLVGEARANSNGRWSSARSRSTYGECTPPTAASKPRQGGIKAPPPRVERMTSMPVPRRRELPYTIDVEIEPPLRRDGLEREVCLVISSESDLIVGAKAGYPDGCLRLP